MTAASGTARTARPRTRDGPASNRIPPARPGSRSPLPPIIGRPGGRLKDASGAARPTGGRAPARSLTRPPGRHGYRSYQGKQETLVTRAQHARQNPQTPVDTAPLLQG